MSSPTKKPHKWTEDQRMVLHILHTDFDLDTHSCAKIFNAVFADDLDQTGVRNGLEDGALKSQWRDRSHKGREHLWQGVLRSPQTEVEKVARKRLVDRVHDAAATLGISTEAVVGEGEADAAEDAGDGESTDNVQAFDAGNSDKDLSGQQADLIATTPNQDVLDMLHTNSVTWSQDGASIKSLTDATIGHSSPYYKHSGEVRSISLPSSTSKGSEASEADFILCDADICPRCSNLSAAIVQFLAEQEPFVHSSDTTMVDRRTYFDPKPKPKPQGRTEKTFLRYVQFNSVKGDVACWVRVCGYVGCDVCISNRSRGSVDSCDGDGEDEERTAEDAA